MLKLLALSVDSTVLIHVTRQNLMHAVICCISPIIQYLPCTSSSPGRLLSNVMGSTEPVWQVMLVAFSGEDTHSIRVELRMFSALFSTSVFIKTSLPLSSCSPLDRHQIELPAATQVKVTLALIEVFMD